MANDSGDRPKAPASGDENGSVVNAETGLLRATLLFAAIAVGLALMVVPAAKHGVQTIAANGISGIDRMTTGSVEKADRYTVRRSVLRNTNGDECAILRHGEKVSSC